MLTIVIVCCNDDQELKKNLREIECCQYLNGLQYLVKDCVEREIPDFIDNSKALNIKYISKRDKGIYDAMNQAIQYVDTEWVLFLGCDDRLLPSCSNLEGYLKGVNSQDCELVYGNVRKRSDGLRYGGIFDSRRMLKENICHQACIYSVHSLRRKPFNTTYRVLSDYCKNLDLILAGSPRYIDLDIAIYNNLSGFSNNNFDFNFYRDLPKMYWVNRERLLSIASIFISGYRHLAWIVKKLRLF